MIRRVLAGLAFLVSANSGYAQDWVKGAVWYQIFPERFFNGDPANDPRIGDQIGSWPHDTAGAWQIHPWTSDWYELRPYEKQNGKALNWNLGRRRYGGDIQGIISKLDYLHELGITAIYLNPIFAAPSSHKYDGEMYHHVEPTFGPDPDGDRKLIASENPVDPATWQWTAADKLALKLIEDCHNRGIRIIFDGVFNHLGTTSFPFRDILKNGKNSQYAGWFTIKQWADPVAGKELDYEGWFGIKDLPELKENEMGIVAEPREYIFNCTKRWMDPNNDGSISDGIDGWRLDVAFCINHNFWKDWRKHVKSINPDAYLTAEVVEPPEKIKPYLTGDEFDAVMNYNVGFALADFFIGDKPFSPTQFDSALAVLRSAFATSPNIQMNLFDSHDTPRMATQIVNRQIVKYRSWGDYLSWSRAAEHRDYLTRKPTADERKIQKQIIAFMMTYVGSPMLYYGTEAGMWGANDPDCRKPMVWKELDYSPECINAQQEKIPACDEVKFDEDLFKFCKDLIQYRTSSIVLQQGTFKAIVMDNKNKVFGFEREHKGKKTMAFFNNSTTTQTLKIKAGDLNYTDIFKGTKISPAAGMMNISVEGKGFLILEGR